MNGENFFVFFYTCAFLLLPFFHTESNNACHFPVAVSWVDDDGEIKEAPIPEQFMHRLVNGTVTSQVSDLYH
jgi:hypothetical protein